MNKDKKILLVGGGTGGHVTPLVAVIEELIENRVLPSNIILVTDKQSSRMGYVLNYQIKVHTIVGGKFHRYFTLANLLTPFLVLTGFVQSYLLLKRIRPDVVLAKGAYLSAPLVVAASMQKIPVFLHESDSIMGSSNRRLSKYAQNIFVSFPIEFYETEIKDKLIFSGLPIRRRFFREEPIFPSNNAKILIWGGSQGADKLNRFIIEKLSFYLQKFELYHICGEKNFNYCENAKKNLPEELKNNYHLYAFLGREIEKVIAACDLIISRAGATSLFELAAMGKAVITIPYPYSASNHQKRNAEYFKDKQAAILLNEQELNAQELFNSVSQLMDNFEKRKELMTNISYLSPKEASKVIVQKLLS